MSQALLEVRGVRKRFGERVVLDVESLSLEAGGSYVLTGGNGSGKTTLLRVLAGLEAASVAEFRFAGRSVDLTRYPQWLRRDLIYVHQHPYVFRSSVAENIAYGLKAHGVAAAERRALVAGAVAWAGLGSLLKVPPEHLSGGEKQRLALARVKVLAPRVYLLDEPTANLDADGRARTLDLIAHLSRADDCVLIACHDREVINLPHMRPLALEEGRLRG